jgi:hypothetical protein
MIIVLVPLLPFLHVASWPALGALFGVVLTMAGLAFVQSRRHVPLWIVIAGNLALVTVFSRIAGPFILTPLLACGTAVALGSQPDLAERGWITIGWMAVALVLPIGLEIAGVLAPTWFMTSEGLVSTGTIFNGRTSTDGVAILLGTLALAVIVGVYTLSMTRARRIAQRAAQIQAWHLNQLLPKKKR